MQTYVFFLKNTNFQAIIFLPIKDFYYTLSIYTSIHRLKNNDLLGRVVFNDIVL